jgi:hypothetical protein
MPMKQYNVRVPEEDLARWRALADAAGMDLSKWIRERCDGGPAPSPEDKRDYDAVREFARQHPDEVVADMVPVCRHYEAAAGVGSQCVYCGYIKSEHPKLKTCPHGKEKGWNCGLCGGLAKVSE